MAKAYVDIIGRDLTSQAFNSAKSKIDGLARGVTAVSGAFAALGAGVFLADAAKQAIEFDASLQKLSTQLGTATKQVSEFEDASKNLSLQFGTKAIEQSAAFYEILSAGITDTAQATSLLTEANKLAIGGNATLMTSIDGLTSIIKGYGGAAGTAAEISDTLFTASLAGKISIEELSTGIGRAVPLAETLGVSFEELTSGVAALTLGGISAEESITGMRAILASVARPSAEAAKLAEELGLNFTSAGIQAKGFAGFMDDVKAKTGGSSDSLAILFGGVQALVPALALTGQAGTEFAGIMGQMASKTGAADDAFTKMAESEGFKIDQLMASINSIALTLGGTLANVLAPAAEKAAKFLNELFGSVKLTAVEEQANKIKDLSAQIESLTDKKHVPLIGDLLFDKKEFDLLTDQLENAKADYADLTKVQTTQAVAQKKSTEAVTVSAAALKTSAKATKEVVSESQRYLDNLRNEAAQAGKTSIEIKKMEAAKLGLSAVADPLIDKIENENAAVKALADQMQRAEQITASVITDEEQLAATQAELNSLLESGAISVDTYNRALGKAQGGLEKTAEVAEKTAGEMDQYFIQASRNIQTSLADSIFDFSKKGFDGLVDNAIDAIKRIVAEFAAMKIAGMAGLTGIFAGASGTAGASTGAAATGTSSGLLNIASLSGSISSAVSNGFSTGFGVTSLLSSTAKTLGSTFGSSALSSFGVAVGGGTEAAAAAGAAGLWGGAGGGASAAASMGSAFAAVAGPAIALLAVDQIGRFIAGDKTTGTIASAIPVIGGFIDALFGHGPLKQKETNLTGVASSSGFDGNTSTKFKSEGGAFTSDNTYRIIIDTQTGEILSSFTSKLNSFAHASQEGSLAIGEFLTGSFKGISAAFKSVGEDMGLATEGIDNFSMGVSIASEKGKSLTDEQIGKVITDFSDALAQQLIPNINLFIKDGETAAGAVARIGMEFNGLVGATSILGVSLSEATDRLKNTTIEGRSAFVDAAGGMDALNQKTSYFAQNFLDGSEILARSTEVLNEQLASLGLSSDLTKDQFKDLVQSFGRVGGVSEDMLLALLDIAPMFNEVRTETERLNPALEETVEVIDELTEAVTLSKDTIYQSVQSLTEVGFDLSRALEIVKNNSAEAIQAFIDAHGGIEAIAATSATFATGFLTSTEQMAAKTEYLSELLKNIGLAADFSVQNARDLILGLGEYTNATNEQKVAFLSILGIFTEVRGTLNDVVPAVEEVIEVIDDLGNVSSGASFGMQTLVNAALNLGLTMQQASALISGYSAEALNAFIAAAGGMAELTSQTEFFKSQFLTAEQQFSADAQALSNALAALGISTSITRAEFTAMVQSFDQGSAMFESLMAIAPLFDSVFDQIEAANAAAAAYVPPEPVLLNGEEIQAAQQALAEAENALQQAHNDLASAYQAEASALQEVSDKFHGLAQTLRSASEALALGELSPLTPMQQYDAAVAALNATQAAAATGDADALAALPQVINDFLAASQVINASGDAYTKDFLMAQAILESAATSADQMASEADQQLAALESQYGELVEINAGIMSVAQAVNNLAVAQAAVTAAQSAIPAEVYSTPPSTPPSTLGALPPPAPNPTPAPSQQQVSDQQIIDFVNQAAGDWMSVYDAAIKYGVSSQRLSSVTGIPMSDIEQWVKDNNVAMFERGTDRVRSTGLALIHKNEAVTPSSMGERITELKQTFEAQINNLMRVVIDSNRENARLVNDAAERVAAGSAWRNRVHI